MIVVTVRNLRSNYMPCWGREMGDGDLLDEG